jgi:hypothetical protein
MSMSGPAVGGFEEGEFEGDSPTEEVAAQIRLRGADAVQLRAQEIDEATKIRIVVQRDPLGVYAVVRRRLRRMGSPVEIEPLGNDEDRKRGGIAARCAASSMIALKPVVGCVSGSAARVSPVTPSASNARRK